MADNIVWEYSAGNSITFKTDDLRIEYIMDVVVVYSKDGTGVVSAGQRRRRVFTFTSLLSGDTMDTLDGVLMAAITYTGAYPRITTLYWDGDSTETNIETAITAFSTAMVTQGVWRVSVTMVEKDE